MRTQVVWASLLAIAVALAGCSSLESVSYPKNSGEIEAEKASAGKDTKWIKKEFVERRTGTTYFLPRRLVKLSLTRIVVPEPLLKAQLSAAKKVQGAAATRKTAAMAALKFAESRLKAADKPGGNQELIDKLKKTVDLAKAEDTAAAAGLGAASARVLELTSQIASKLEARDTLKLELLPAEPDTNHAYVARLDHSAFSSDDLTIQTTENGLLKSVNLELKDETPQIILELAKTVVQAYRLSVGLPGHAKGGHGVMGDPKPVPFKFERIFDPADPESVDVVNRELLILTGKGEVTQYEVEVVQQELRAGEGLTDLGAEATEVGGKLRVPVPHPTFAPIPGKEIDGLVYRRSIPYRVSILSGAKGKMYSMKAAVAYLPNNGPAAVLPFDAGAFTTTIYGAEFANGELTKYTAKRPSEVLGFVSLLPKAVSELVSIPGEILKLKVDYSSQEKAVEENLKAILETRNAIRQMQSQADTPVVEDVPADGE